MIQTVSFTDFRDAFRNYDRLDTFSYEGSKGLFDYLEEMESGGEQIELDVVALCCDYCESSYSEVAEDYSIDVEGMNDDELQTAVLDHLNYNTSVIWSDSNRVLFAQF